MRLAFPNLVGAHCSSSALRSVLAFDSVDLSEALTFGLGSGLGFFYLEEPNSSPTRRFNGRAPNLEGNFYRLVGQPIQWVEAWQPDLIAESLAANRPRFSADRHSPHPLLRRRALYGAWTCRCGARERRGANSGHRG